MWVKNAKNPLSSTNVYNIANNQKCFLSSTSACNDFWRIRRLE